MGQGILCKMKWERRLILVHGTVQGVGFRPFVHTLATRLQLGGQVRNQNGSVQIEVEGDADSLEAFQTELEQGAPSIARIEGLKSTPLEPRGEREFAIAASTRGEGDAIAVSPDLAVCEACLHELRDPADRRFGYPFLNCTACGPRLSIVTGAPYDRERTSMAGFELCPACREEYEAPVDRRFHAQPTACPNCGPRLMLRGASGELLNSDNSLQDFAQAIRAEKIGALKGIGGFHLVCLAKSNLAVAELRGRKGRDEKPLAVMMTDLRQAREICEVPPEEARLLTSMARPIVLCRRRRDLASEVIAHGVAPGNPYLGILLPYAPVHYLLLEQLDSQPLVMTSGNRSDEPIAYLDAEAAKSLAGIADVTLGSDRPIQVRCDDSVLRVIDGHEFPLRRSRGYAPQSLTLPQPCPCPLLAVGGQLKNVFALGQGDRAVLSHHLGDLDHLAASQAFVRDIALYEQLFQIQPQCLVHDLHPDYASTRYALERAEREGLKLLAVQHHHAHLAGCLAEHGLEGPAIGVIFDGSGYGPDGTIWGGEFLVGDLAGYRRAARLRPVPLPGGEQAVRQPWRMGVAYLLDAGCSRASVAARVSSERVAGIEQMLTKRVNAPLTSSMGRLFDAIASIAGVRDNISYEGQAAQEWEWLAQQVTKEDSAYPYALHETDGLLELDFRPLVIALLTDVEIGLSAARMARRFHTTLVQAVVEVVLQLRRQTGLASVVLSGGVFANAILSSELAGRLAGEGLEVLRHRQTPAGDGGLSFGQLAVAAANLNRGSTPATEGNGFACV